MYTKVTNVKLILNHEKQGVENKYNQTTLSFEEPENFLKN